MLIFVMFRYHELVGCFKPVLSFMAKEKPMQESNEKGRKKGLPNLYLIHLQSFTPRERDFLNCLNKFTTKIRSRFLTEKNGFSTQYSMQESKNAFSWKKTICQTLKSSFHFFSWHMKSSWN